MYANTEQDQLCEFYTEFDSDKLWIQLSTLAESYHSFRQGDGVGDTLHNIIDFLKKNKKVWSLIPEVMTLVKLTQVMPVTNASSECQLWTRLQYTVKGEVLYLMTYTVLRELVKGLNFKQVTDDFVDIVDRRSSIFGHFSTYRDVDECLCLSLKY